MLKFSILDHAAPDGKINIGVPRPVEAPSFSGLLARLMHEGQGLRNPIHPGDSPDNRGTLTAWAPACMTGSTRKNVGLEWSVLGVDFDENVKIPMGHIAERLDGIAGMVHTTTHHSEAKPSYRLILSLSRPLTSEDEIKAMLRKVEERVGPGINHAASNINRIFFLMHGGYDFRMIEGEPLDVDTLLGTGVPDDEPLDPDAFEGDAFDFPVEPGGYEGRTTPGPVSATAGQLTDRQRKWVASALDAVYNEIQYAEDGVQNNTINGGAYRLGKFVSAGLLTQDEATATLMEAARAGNHPEHRAAGAIASGLSDGIAAGGADIGLPDGSVAEVPVVQVADIPVADRPRVPVPVELLPPEMQSAMAALSALHNVPHELSLPCCLAVANFAAQGLYDVDSLAFGKIAISEFLVALAPSTGAKSTVYKELTVPLTDWEANERDRYEADLGVYRIRKAAYDDAVKKNKATGLEAPEAPLHYRRTVEQPTTVGLFKALERGFPSMALFTSEGGQFLSSHAFGEGNTTVQLATTLTKLWDAQGLTRDTRDDGLDLYHRRFCMLVMVQPEIAGQLANPVLQGQGLIGRMLISHSPSFEMPDLDLSPAAEDRVRAVKQKFHCFHRRIWDLLNRPMPTRAGKRQELDLPVLAWSGDAKAMIQGWYNTMKADAAYRQEGVQVFAKRALEHACRLAGTIAIFCDHRKIEVSDIQAATALMDFYLDQRIHLDSHLPDQQLDPRRANHRLLGEKLVDWLKAHPSDAGYTLRHLMIYGPNTFRKLPDSKEQQALLASCVAWGWLEEVVVQQKKRKSPGWRLLKP